MDKRAVVEVELGCSVSDWSSRRLLGLGLPELTKVNVADLDVVAWVEPVRRALKRSREIVVQRHEAWPLRAYEYQQFYSAWVGLAFRFRACATHDAAFTASFSRSGGAPADEEMYEEDEALYGFFVKGLSVLDCLGYGLYALGALICTPTAKPSLPPPPEFPLLESQSPTKLRKITTEEATRAYEQRFPGRPITSRLQTIKGDSAYRNWKDVRNVLAHRSASAGRTLDYSNSPIPFLTVGHPQEVTQWGGGITLNAATTTTRYQWLRDTINASLEEAAAFATAELPYGEVDLPRPLVE